MTLNRDPRGLLGFFDQKNGGQNPGELSAQLAATIDLRDWYTETNAEILGSGNEYLVGPAIGAYVPNYAPGGRIEVPQSEFWLVHSYSIQVRTEAGGGSAGTISCSVAPTFETIGATLTGSSSGQAVVVGPQQSVIDTVAATLQPTFQVTADRKFFAPPGALFGLYLALIDVAGEARVSQVLRFTRCRI